MNDATTNQMPSSVLRAEHQAIPRVIGVLERLVIRTELDNGFEKGSLRRCVDFFQYFADGLEAQWSN